MTTSQVDPRHRPAIRATVQRYERPLVGFVQQYVHNLDTAREVAQDTFLRLCQQAPDQLDQLLDPTDRSQLEGWLFVVARNAAIDAQRKLGRTLVVEAPAITIAAEGDSPADAAANAELADRIIAMIDTLPPKQAEVVRLRFQQGLSYKSIASLTGQTVSYVGYLLHEGLKGLRNRASAQVPKKETA